MTVRRAGFSLIEALVALTIAAMVLGAIFELQIQMARGQQRAMDAMAQVTALENAIALTRDINFMEEPTGRIDLSGGDTIQWTSRAKAPAVTNVGFPAGDGIFEVQMFSVTVNMERSTGRSPAPLVFDRVGWRRKENVGF